MDRDSVRAQLPALVTGHLPKNSRRFQFAMYDDQPSKNRLGQLVDPKPFAGKVITVTEDAIIVKTARTEFAVVDRALASDIPGCGDHIEVRPYCRRDFNGDRIDQPRCETQTIDGQEYTTRTVLIGGWRTKLPVEPGQNEHLNTLIEQLENLPAPDGVRRIVHLLVDAGATDFAVVDPTDANVIATPPEISFAVATERYVGRVAILYDRGNDYYVIELRQSNQVIERFDNIGFDELGRWLESLIDDGQWRRVRITVIEPARGKQSQGTLIA